MAYPDTTNNLTGITDKVPGGASGTEWKAATVNPWVTEINAITTELGANPKGGYADVDARLDAIESSSNGGIPKVSPATAGNLPKLKADGTLEDSLYDPSDFAASGHDHDSDYIGIVETPTAGNLPALTAAGDLIDSGYDPSDFATSGHNHDSAYSAIGHDHDSNYSAIGHDHDSDYISVVGTPTAGNLAALTTGGELADSGSKPADFAAAAHNHDSAYSAIGHNHSGIYDPAGTAASAVTSHEGASDPHTGYQKESEKGAASGYASLNASSLVTENPANAQTTAAANKIPLADSGGKIATGWVPSMTGATTEDAGAAGLVPAPAAGDQAKVLSGAGTWVTQSGGGGDNVSVNGAACSDVDLDDDGVTADAGRVLVEWKTSGSGPTKVNCQTPASVPVVLDREISTTINTSWTAALTHAVPAGSMGTNRTLRFTLSGYYRNWSGSAKNMYLRIKFGSTVMCEVTMPMGISSSAYRPITIKGNLANLNATNSQAVAAEVIFMVNTSNPTTGYGGATTSGFAVGALRGAASEDTTAAVTLEVALYRADASNVSITIDQAILELV